MPHSLFQSLLARPEVRDVVLTTVLSTEIDTAFQSKQGVSRASFVDSLVFRSFLGKYSLGCAEIQGFIRCPPELARWMPPAGCGCRVRIKPVCLASRT